MQQQQQQEAEECVMCGMEVTPQNGLMIHDEEAPEDSFMCDECYAIFIAAGVITQRARYCIEQRRKTEKS